MRDFDLRGIEHDLLAAEARASERVAIRRRILDNERRASSRLRPWLDKMAVLLGIGG
jgi:hypothetical protein